MPKWERGGGKHTEEFLDLAMTEDADLRVG